VLAIDPGNTHSGWVLMQGREVVKGASKESNEALRLIVMQYAIVPVNPVDLIAIEWVQSYGMTVGKEVFHTCRWVGRFQDAAEHNLKQCKLVYRRDVKLHLCNSTKAKDGNVRQAILDLYPATGGGKRPQIGTKKQPGPLYGVSGHMWPAVGLALTVQESELSPIE
jgi:hypothetical protein